MKIFIRFFITTILFISVLVIPILDFQTVIANSSKPTADQFEDAEEALEYEKYNDVINGGSVYDTPSYEEIGVVLAINYLVSFLDTTYTSVSGMADIASSDRQSILNEITSFKDGLQNQKSTIETRVNQDAQTELDRVKDLIAVTDIYCDEIYVRFHYWNGKIMQSRINSVYAQLNAIINDLENQVSTSSKDLSEATLVLNSAKEQLATLATKKDLSAKKFESITSKDTASLYLNQGKQYVGEAKSTAKELKNDLATVIFHLEN